MELLIMNDINFPVSHNIQIPENIVRINKKKELETIMENNPINPSHYKSQIECIDAIKSALSPDEFRGFLKGNILKYVWRESQKNGLEDLKKAQWYLEKMIDFYEP